jgi:hypothetical protein
LEKEPFYCFFLLLLTLNSAFFRSSAAEKVGRVPGGWMRTVFKTEDGVVESPVEKRQQHDAGSA